MNLNLTEDQQLIRNAARAFLEKQCPPAYVRAMETDEKGYAPEQWKSMAELGWMGLPFPEEFGGVGSGFLELCVLIEEHGRFRLPGPFFSTVVLCGMAIARFGSAKQKSELVPAIASGERILAYAESEANATWEASGIEMAATAEDDGYVLKGTKRLVSYAAAADTLLVVARTGGKGERGITVFLVDAASPGITREPLRTIASDHQYQVTFDGVRVPKSRVLGKSGKGWPIVEFIRQWGAAAKCAEMVGGAERVLEMTLDYAKVREQFGKPIGSFQAIQHHCANMAVDVLGARFIAYEAIWRLSEGLDAAAEVSMAKAWTSDAYQRVCGLGHQIHGAIGFTKEHDLQLYSRSAKAAELSFGDADYHRERVAEWLAL
ncbi:MAG: acyl-CoA/acyl-ACP dehydrogenase [Betaproteobacteria bacterium]|nr:MAG: acyl-CoA/acyl-ACP dehydrogenase [Betaproteobacteria bacterium]